MRCEGDSVDAAEQLKVFEYPKMFAGSIAGCFLNIFNSLGAPVLKKHEDANLNIPFESIRELNFLGSGAQGTVFSGRLNGEMVAVKKLRENCDNDVKHLRRLNHDNIVRFRGVSNDTACYCVIMEYCQYGSLYDYLHSGVNLLPAQVMKWAKDIALGMAYLHAHNIIHRDLKSPNVLIADDLTVKVSDFGTSREWKNVSTLMSFTGTVAWMAPEVIRHEPCSEKVDVWSFGVVLWELMTKEIPFKNLEAHAIMWGVGTDSLSLPIPTGCPNTIQVIICQCWQRIPKNRPPFKILAAHLDMATPDIAATDAKIFAARQKDWAAEVREVMDRIYAKNESQSHSEVAAPDADAPPPREALRQVREVYDQQINRANELFMEVCSVRLQLEQRERALAEREKQLKACRCGQRKGFRIKRQSSTSSDGKPVTCKQPRKKKPEQQLLVNYIDRDEGMTYTVAVDGCICVGDGVGDSVLNNNLKTAEGKRATVVEENGNVAVEIAPVHKQKPPLDNVIPDVAQV